MKIVVLGVSGMLGSQVFFSLHRDERYDVYGTLRQPSVPEVLSSFGAKIITSVSGENIAGLEAVLKKLRTDVVINCIGLVKQRAEAAIAVSAITLNALFPHRVAELGVKYGFRTIHVSTDCVFSGSLGGYREVDTPDAEDIYGRSKLLGELSSDNCLTLRTSIIGHELNSNRSLVDWFLSQKKQVLGYKDAIFSGLPTVELASVIANLIIPNRDLGGLWHVSAEPINKFELLSLIKKHYEVDVTVIRSDAVQIDRSLNSDLFRRETGYQPPKWEELIKMMKTSRWYYQDEK